MTLCGFCVVAALSSQTNGRPLTRSRRIGKSRLNASASKGYDERLRSLATSGSMPEGSCATSSDGVIERALCGKPAGATDSIPSWPARSSVVRSDLSAPSSGNAGAGPGMLGGEENNGLASSRNENAGTEEESANPNALGIADEG